MLGNSEKCIYRRSERHIAAAVGGLGVLLAGTIVTPHPVGESRTPKSAMFRCAFSNRCPTVSFSSDGKFRFRRSDTPSASNVGRSHDKVC